MALCALQVKAAEHTGQLHSFDCRLLEGQPVPWPASLHLASCSVLQKHSVKGDLTEFVNSKEITFRLQSRLSPEVFLNRVLKLPLTTRLYFIPITLK